MSEFKIGALLACEKQSFYMSENWSSEVYLFVNFGFEKKKEVGYFIFVLLDEAYRSVNIDTPQACYFTLKIMSLTRAHTLSQ